MAHILLKNSLNNSIAAKVNLSFVRHYDVNSSNGDPVWLLEVATTYPSASGNAIIPTYVSKVTSLEDMDVSIQEALSSIASQIEWTPLIEDTSAPYVEKYGPIGNSVSIASNISLDLCEDLPTSGIDLSEMQVILDNGVVEFDITEECLVTGVPFDYNIRWEPPSRLHKRYEEE